MEFLLKNFYLMENNKTLNRIKNPHYRIESKKNLSFQFKNLFFSNQNTIFTLYNLYFKKIGVPIGVPHKN